MFVVDASVAITWYLEDEATVANDRLSVRALAEGLVVPQMWHLEIANALLSAVRRRRIGRAYRDAVLDDLGRYQVAVDGETARQAWASTATLVDRYDLTPYDAAYLELALRLGLPLATIDEKLAASARSEGVAVLP